MRIPLTAALAATAVASLLLSACGSNTLSGGDASPAPTSSVSADADLNAKLPEKIRSAGTIKIGTDASYAPNQFTEGDKIVGSEVDLFSAVAKKMGVEAEFENAPFATIIPGVTSAKYDLGVSSFTINDERLKQVQMVSYFSAGTQWATAAGNPNGVDPENPCGKTIAVQKATVQDLDDLPVRQKKCGCGSDQDPAVHRPGHRHRGGRHRQGRRHAGRLPRDGVRGVEVGRQARAAG